MKEILSLGAGWQSSTILLMSCVGELPKPDMAIFADTKWEPEAVYEHLFWLKNYAEKCGIPVHIVSKDGISLREKLHQTRTSKDGNQYVALPIPAWTKDDKTGKIGKISQRHCTGQYKIEVIDKFIKKQLGIFGKRHPEDPIARIWIGISTDEVKRAKISNEKWKENHFPLIIDRPFSRQQCGEWLRENFPDRNIPRSACVGCPYRDNKSWRDIRENPKEWEDALLADKQIRNAYNESTKFVGGQVFLHHSCVPLDQADIEDPEYDQTDWLSECTGMCGL